MHAIGSGWVAIACAYVHRPRIGVQTSVFDPDLGAKPQIGSAVRLIRVRVMNAVRAMVKLPVNGIVAFGNRATPASPGGMMIRAYGQGKGHAQGQRSCGRGWGMRLVVGGACVLSWVGHTSCRGWDMVMSLSWVGHGHESCRGY